ncbi:unnamed protein product [Colias eurytheme]|nr:unnamed protein product [Colias eurytheme]
MSFLFGSAVCLSVVPENSVTEYRYTPRSMSNSGLTSEAQLRYMIQWFEEFSELQREDFLPILAAAHGDKPEQLAAGLASLTCEDKPVSLFQCRIKLFNEWFPTWAEEQRDRLLKAVTEIDVEFGNKLQDILVNGVKVNGTDDFFSTNETVGEKNTEENEDIPNIQADDNSLANQDVVVEIAAAS